MVTRRVHPAVVIQCHQAEDIPQRPDTVNTGDMRNRAVPQRACCHPCQSRSSEASRRPARQDRHSRFIMRFGQAVWVRQCPHGNGLKFRPSSGWTTTTTLAGMGTSVKEPHFLPRWPCLVTDFPDQRDEIGQWTPTTPARFARCERGPRPLQQKYSQSWLRPPRCQSGR